MVLRNLINSFVLSGLPFMAIGQLQREDSLLFLSFNDCKEAYFNAVGSELSLNNGTLYREYIPNDTDQGTPYFGTDEFMEGTILYDDIFFENIPLLYDVVHDKVITSLSTSTNKLELISDKVKYFELSGHRFIPLNVPENGSQIQIGFVELLHEGKIKLYVKWKKERKKITESGEMQIRYDDQNRIYINKNDKILPIKTKSSLVHALEDKKKEVLKFIRENRLDFNNHKLESCLKIISFYESRLE
jgi:hypothetical protein